MILSKLYQGHKARKNRRLVGFCFSLLTKAASRGNLFFFFVQYICEIRRRLANRTAARFSWDEHAKSPFVFAMHQSFVSTAPLGPGISGAFNFSISKAPLKALHSGAKIMVKSLLKAPPSRGLTIMKKSKLPGSFE